MKRALPLVLLLLLCVPGEAADDEPATKSGADRIVRDWDAGQREIVERAARARRLDPWLLSLRLCARGRGEIAAAIATANHRAELERLAEHVREWRQAPVAQDLLDRWDLVEAALDAKDWEAVLTRSTGVVGGSDAFLDLNVALARGRALFALGRVEASLEPLGEAAEGAGAVGWLNGQCRALAELGHAQQMTQDYEGAFESWTRCAAVYDRRNLTAAAAQTRANVGSLALVLGDARAAVRELDRALEVLRENEWVDAVAMFLRNRAWAREHLGEYAGALADLREARRISKRLEDAMGVADGDLGLATMLMKIGDFEPAERAARRAIEGFQEAKDPEGEARAYGTLGLVQGRRGDPEGAVASFERCRRMSLDRGDELNAARALANLAVVQGLGGAHDEAIRRHRQALEQLRRLKNPRGELDALYWIAELQRRAGRTDEAAKGFRAAHRMAHEYDVAEVLIDAHQSLAEIEHARGRHARAMQEVRDAVEVMGRSTRGLGQEQGAMARVPRRRVFQIGLEAAAQIHDAAGFSYFLECGRAGALLETLEAREAIRDAAIPKLLRDKEEAARTAEAAARARFGSARDAGELEALRRRRDELDRAQAAVRDAVEEIHRQAIAGAELLYPQPLPLETIRAALAPNEALVQYALMEDAAYALVATRRDARVVPLGKTSKIDEHAARAADMLADRDSTPGEALATLHDLVVRPLGLRADVERLLVLPDGDLYIVPLQTLAPTYVTSYVPSATTAARLRGENEAGGTDVLALGDPVYRKMIELGPERTPWRQRLTPLPGSRLEAKAIGSRVLLGEAATEQGLREALAAHGRWRAVHLACHGLIDPGHPMRSALALTPAEPDDGFLTALEVLQMRVDTDLAVLSACESGRGTLYRGEGLVGLTRAFMVAGAPRLLVSLWRVDDEATRALMVAFYARWAPKDGSEGLDAAAALKAAQEHVRSIEKWSHPSYWAAWVLWGQP